MPKGLEKSARDHGNDRGKEMIHMSVKVLGKGFYEVKDRYIVHYTEGKGWSCTCQYKSLFPDSNHECKHIRFVKRKLEDLKKLEEALKSGKIKSDVLRS